MKSKALCLAFAAASVLSSLSLSASAAPSVSPSPLGGQSFAMKSEVATRAAMPSQKLAFGYWICWADMDPSDCYWLPGD